MSEFIKLRVIGDILLRNDADYVALMDNGSYIIELAAEFIRKTGNNYRIKIRCLLSEIV